MTDVSSIDGSSGSHSPEDDSELRIPSLGSGLGSGLEDSEDELDEVSDESDVMALELDRLITEYFDAHREGRAPSVDDYVADHPEHEHALRAVLPGASLLDQMGKRAEDHSPRARSGDRLGEYKLLGILGRGGMGVVYEAVQESLGRPVALKVLPASRVVDRKSRERFMREAQAAASLQHPGIVPVYGVGEADGQVYYAMQRVDGVPLDLLTAVARGDSGVGESSAQVDRAIGVVARLRGEGVVGSSGGSGSSEVALAGSSSEIGLDRSGSGNLVGAGIGRSWISNSVLVAQQIAEALSYAHSRGVLHRDVKPSNVMLDESGRAYVTDFGLCKVEDSSSLTAAGDVVGTLRYVPPERFQGRDDARGDVYGVGMILYELLCGRPAFNQKDRATLVQAVTLQSPPKPRKLNPDIPVDLERIVLTAIAKLPEERYSSSESLIADLAAFQSGRPIRARAPGKLYLAKLFAQRNRGLVTTIAASAALLLLLGVLYIRDLGRMVREVEAGREHAERMSYHAQMHAAVEASRNANGGAGRALRILDSVSAESRDWVWLTLRARLDVGLKKIDVGLPPILDMQLDADETSVVVLRERSVRVQGATTGDLVYEAPLEGGKGVAFIPGTKELLVIEGDSSQLRRIVRRGDQPSELGTLIEERLELLGTEGISGLTATSTHLAVAWQTGQVVSFAMSDPDTMQEFSVAPAPRALLEFYGTEGRLAYAPYRGPLAALGPESGRVRDVAGGVADKISSLSGARRVNVFAGHGPTSGSVVRYVDDDGDTVDQREATLSQSGVVDLAMSPAGESVIGQFGLGKARIWSRLRGTSPVRVASYLSKPRAILWPKGKDVILVGGQSGEWRLLPRPSFNSGMPGVSEIRGHYNNVEVLTFDGNGEFFATAEDTGAWVIWSLQRHKPTHANVSSLKPVHQASLASVDDRPAFFAVAGDEVGVWALSKDGFQPPVYESWAKVPDVIGLSWRTPGGFAAPRELIIATADSVQLARMGPVSGSEAGGAEDGSETETGANLSIVWDPEEEITATAHHRGAGVTMAATADGQVWRLRVGELGLESAEVVARLDARVTSIGIGTLAEKVGIVTEAEELHVADLAAAEPSIRWARTIANPGTQSQAATAVAIDEDSGWVVTGGADGALELWAVLDGAKGPTLETRYGRFSGIVFPRAGVPPVSVEERGRVTLIETSGAERMRELAAIEPTAMEELSMAWLAPRVRLVQVERMIKNDKATDVQLEQYERLAHGLEFYTRYHEPHRNRQAAKALSRIRAVIKRRAAAQAKGSQDPSDAKSNGS